MGGGGWWIGFLDYFFLPEKRAELDLVLRNSCSKYLGNQMTYPTTPKTLKTLLPQPQMMSGLRMMRQKEALNSWNWDGVMAHVSKCFIYV